MTIAAFAGGGSSSPAPAARRGGHARRATASRVWIAQGCGSLPHVRARQLVGPIGPDLELALAGKDARVREAHDRRPNAAARDYTGMPDDFATRISPPDLDRLVDFLRQRTIGCVIDHVDIRVADRDASERFYDTVLAVLGLEQPTPTIPSTPSGATSRLGDGQPGRRRTSTSPSSCRRTSSSTPSTARRRGRLRGRRRARPAPAVPRGLLRRLPARPRRQQRRGRDEHQEPQDGRDRPPLAAHARLAAPSASTSTARASSSASTSPTTSSSSPTRASFSFVTGEPATEHVHIAFSAATNEAGRRVPPGRDRRRLQGQRRARRARRLSPRLLRGLRPRSRRPQHRGRQPQPLEQAVRA